MLKARKIGNAADDARGLIAAGFDWGTDPDGFGIECYGRYVVNGIRNYKYGFVAHRDYLTFVRTNPDGTYVETNWKANPPASDMLVVEAINLYEGSSYPSVGAHSFVYYNDTNISKQGYTALGILGVSAGNGAVIGSGTVYTNNTGQYLLIKYINAGDTAQSFAPSVHVLWGKV